MIKAEITSDNNYYLDMASRYLNFSPWRWLMEDMNPLPTIEFSVKTSHIFSEDTYQEGDIRHYLSSMHKALTGDCDNLDKQFAKDLKRFTNVTGVVAGADKRYSKVSGLDTAQINKLMSFLSQGLMAEVIQVLTANVDVKLGDANVCEYVAMHDKSHVAELNLSDTQIHLIYDMRLFCKTEKGMMSDADLARFEQNPNELQLRVDTVIDFGEKNRDYISQNIKVSALRPGIKIEKLLVDDDLDDDTVCITYKGSSNHLKL